MSQWQMYIASGCAVVAVALYGLFTCEHVVRKIIAANLMGSGVFLVLIALGRRGPPGSTDPVPQALVLTGIVVSVSTTACALALARRLSLANDSVEPRGDGAADGEADGE